MIQSQLQTRPGLSAEAVAHAFATAIDEAELFAGSTSPNPPVACVVLDGLGKVLACAAHQMAGMPHAEASAIDICRKAGVADQIDTVVVTLEPCNHFGRTPPCSEAILNTSARTVWVGMPDPNPRVTGGGAVYLQARGLSVHYLETLEHPNTQKLLQRASRLIGPFRKWSLTGQPWITVKQALTADGGMIPPPGQKTFTSEASLLLAHRLRRRADAIITGSGTILADDPMFTVRHIEDHSGKRRYLTIFDRRGRVLSTYREAARARGFDVMIESDIGHALTSLGKVGVLEALVEAGPTLSNAFVDQGLWDERVIIRRNANPGGLDLIETLNHTQ